MNGAKSEYQDKYRDWFKEHWVKDEWLVEQTPPMPLINRHQQTAQTLDKKVETAPELLAISQPSVRNAIVRPAQRRACRSRPNTAEPNGRYQRLQQWQPKHRHTNDEGLRAVMKTMEQDTLNYKDEMHRNKKRGDDLEEKLSFLQNTLLTQNNKIKKKNQVITEMNDALEDLTAKYNLLQRKQPALERKIKEFSIKQQDWNRERASLTNQINNIASQKVYEVDKMHIFQGDLKKKLEEKNAMISLLDDNIDKLKSDVDIDQDSKQKLKQLQRENNRMKILLESKQMELAKMREIFVAESKTKRVRNIKSHRNKKMQKM